MKIKESLVKSSRVEFSEDRRSLGTQTMQSKQGRIVDETQERSDDARNVFDTDALHGDESDYGYGSCFYSDEDLCAKIDELIYQCLTTVIDELKWLKLLLKSNQLNLKLLLCCYNNTIGPMARGVVQEPSSKKVKRNRESSKGTKEEMKLISQRGECVRRKLKADRKKILGKKRARKEHQQESSKRKIMEEIKETVSMKKLSL
ncbi:hypothetical protein Tco_0109646 [Tanacetum coccineum]